MSFSKISGERFLALLSIFFFSWAHRDVPYVSGIFLVVKYMLENLETRAQNFCMTTQHFSNSIFDANVKNVEEFIVSSYC